MPALVFKKAALMKFGANNITDHNRSEVSISVERIEKKQRMANGRMRKYVVADKRSFSCSWEMLPSTGLATVDGFLGANEIETFYKNNKGEFDLTLTFTKPDLTGTYTEVYKVMFSEFEKTLLKRGKYDFYNLSLTLEEV